MTGVITLLDQPRTLDALGRATDALIYFYLTGTSVLAPIYEDAALITPAANPIDLAAGEIFPDIFLDPSIQYRRRILYGDGTIHDVDPLPATGQINASDVAYNAGLTGSVNRTQASKNLEFVSVKDFGAKGDGVTSDTTAINNAIANAPANGVLYFPAGIYIVDSTVTVARDNLTIEGYGATIRAKDNTVFEYVLFGTARTNIKIIGLTFDANRAGRTSGQNIRYMGAGLTLSTDCEFVECTGTNAVGYSSIPGVGITFGGGIRCHIRGCLALNNGGTSGTNAADGFYVSGDNCTITDCTAENCTDTGMVIESSNNSGIIGGTAKSCNAAFAVTNVTNFDKRGNFIRGATAIDWNSTVTGGIQIGVPASVTGNLIDTSIDVTLVVVTGGKGTGPAINVRRVGTGRTDGLNIKAMINGASTQGILVDGSNVVINDSYIRGTTAACIQFQTGATGEVKTSTIVGGGFGIIAAGTANVRTTGNTILGNATATFGLYAFDTSTIYSTMDYIEGQTVNRISKDGGAFTNTVRFNGTGIELNGVQIIGPRATGWGAPTGTTTKTTFATGSVTLPQLAERVKGLIDDLTTAGMIGT